VPVYGYGRPLHRRPIDHGKRRPELAIATPRPPDRTLPAEEPSFIAFARQFDQQWFHIDPERATASRWHGPIASGWRTCCLAMKLVVDNVLAGSESFGSPGLTNLNWSNPVRPGDELRLQIEVTDVRTARSRPRWASCAGHGGCEIGAMPKCSVWKQRVCLN